MIDYKERLVAALAPIGTVHYENFTNSATTIPCITYMETQNLDLYNGDTLDYSILEYTIKV